MTELSVIRVMIVDDHAMVRDGLKVFLLIFDDVEVVGEARNGEQAVELCGRLLPDVVLMDMVMPGMGGPAATRAIRERYPQVKVIALTSYTEETLVQQAIQAGAIGYLLKDVEPEELMNAIRAAQAGQPTLAPIAAQALIQVTTGPPRPGTDLTRREREVLNLMVKGQTNAEIARQLTLSPSTVNFHVSNILAKLGTTNRTEAVSLAVRDRLVERLKPSPTW